MSKGWLVFGASGWVGGLFIKLLKEKGETVISAKSRLENRAAVIQELDQHNPKYVVNAAGKTGRPNVDWCEDHRPETLRANVLGAGTLADACFLKNAHLTAFSSGCIYEYDDSHCIGGVGFKETDPPNYASSFYSRTKIMAEEILSQYPNVLQLRLRMPVSDDLHGRSLLTKLTKYERVVNVPNSISILSDLLPIAYDLARKQKTGIYNFVNPGTISHNEVLAAYKKHVQPNFTWKNFSLEEQAKILKCGRSNNHLDVSKLLKEYPDVPPVKTSFDALCKRLGETSK